MFCVFQEEIQDKLGSGEELDRRKVENNVELINLHIVVELYCNIPSHSSLIIESMSSSATFNSKTLIHKNKDVFVLSLK